MDRRELLKRFGIGAIIAPVIGGLVLPGVTAELIQVPKVKPVELFAKIPESLDMRNVKSVAVVFGMEDGTARTIKISDMEFHQRSVLYPGDPSRAIIDIWQIASPSSGDISIKGTAELI